VLLDGGHVTARGTHADLLSRFPGYREAIERETADRPRPPLGTDEGDTRAGHADAGEPADRDPVGGGRPV